MTMTKREQQATSTSNGSAALGKKLVAASAVVLVLVLGLSIIWANNISSPNAADADTVAVANKTDGSNESPSATRVGQGVGMAALQEAAAANKYLFAFFWKADSPHTESLRKVFEQATKQVEDRAQAVAVCVTDAAESEIVRKYELTRAPMPLALAIAPNGAIMGGFPGTFTEEDLLDAFGSPALEQSMKALQDGKLVLLCAQNDSTSSNAEALKGVEAFRDDPRFTAATEIVKVDPSDSVEASFMRDLKIDSGITEAVTAFLVPPGSVIAEFQGATTKEQLLAALQSAGSCGPGGVCGPGGCAPQ
jgi:hypothetical protein